VETAATERATSKSAAVESAKQNSPSIPRSVVDTATVVRPGPGVVERIEAMMEMAAEKGERHTHTKKSESLAFRAMDTF